MSFKRPAARVRQVDEPGRPAAACAPTVCRGTYGPAVLKAAPKTEPKRNARLLAMARGMPCLLNIRSVCLGGHDTTVAAHSNWAKHGKAGARKADDQFTVWSCMACHSWLDQGKADGITKELAFMHAHLDQVLAWRLIAGGTSGPDTDRRAAQWALDQLNATPVASLET